MFKTKTYILQIIGHKNEVDATEAQLGEKDI
jgi:hypothetical protein